MVMEPEDLDEEPREPAPPLDDQDDSWQMLQQEILSLENEFQSKKQTACKELADLAELLAAQGSPSLSHNDALGNSQDRQVETLSSYKVRDRRRLLHSDLETSALELLEGVKQLKRLGETTMGLLNELKSLDSDS